MDLTGVAALTFDCYGTIVDWEAGILAELEPWARRHRLPATADELLLRFAEHETRVQGAEPTLRYPQVLERVFAALEDSWELPRDAAAAAAFGGSIARWPPFRDSADALRRLGRRFRLAVISNVDRASFAATSAALGIAFDAVVTAEDTGFWKPDPRAFAAAFERLARLGIRRESTVHVAQSLYHDHVPASALGLRTVFVDRRQGRRGGAAPPPAVAVTPDLTVPDLAALSRHAGIG